MAIQMGFSQLFSSLRWYYREKKTNIRSVKKNKHHFKGVTHQQLNEFNSLFSVHFNFSKWTKISSTALNLFHLLFGSLCLIWMIEKLQTVRKRNTLREIGKKIASIYPLHSHRVMINTAYSPPARQQKKKKRKKSWRETIYGEQKFYFTTHLKQLPAHQTHAPEKPLDTY